MSSPEGEGGIEGARALSPASEGGETSIVTTRAHFPPVPKEEGEVILPSPPPKKKPTWWEVEIQLMRPCATPTNPSGASGQTKLMVTLFDEIPSAIGAFSQWWLVADNDAIIDLEGNCK
jgi:hypothetical protein